MQSQTTVYYLCLQVTRIGQASYSHVHEILSGLRKRGVNTGLFEPAYENLKNEVHIFWRLLNFISIQCSLIFSRRPDLIYIRWHFATILVSLWAKFRKIPVIQEVNGPYEDLFQSYPWTRKFEFFFVSIMRLQLKLADAVIAVTPQLSEWVVNETNNLKIFTVSNGANTTIFNSDVFLPSTMNIHKQYAVFFGALSVWQGIDIMLEAFNSPYWPQDVALVIVGGGVESKKVYEAASSSNFLFYFEPLEQRELAGIVCNSLCSLSPQVGHRCSTGLFPLKLFESLACSVPVVVSDWPGMADFVRDHQCGIVVPPGDPEALALAVAKFASDPTMARTMGARGSEEVRLNHSWDAKAEEIFQIICDILSKFSDKTTRQTR